MNTNTKATLKSLKGTFDIYAILQCNEEAFINDVTSIEALRRVRKTLTNAEFYARQGKLPQGYSLAGFDAASTNVRAILTEMSSKFSSDVGSTKAKVFHSYTVEEINALELPKLRAYGRCLASYLCHNGADDKYQEFYGYYINALDAATTKGINKADISKLLGVNMTKAQLLAALEELTK